MKRPNPFNLSHEQRLFIGRDDLKQRIGRFISEEIGVRHLLIAGPRGVGKSTLVNYLCTLSDWTSDHSRPLAIVIPMTSGDNMKSVFQRFLTFADAAFKEKSFTEQLVRLKKSVLEELGRDHGLQGVAAAARVLRGPDLVEMNLITEAFCETLQELVSKVKRVIVAFDEADTIDTDRFPIGSFLKLTLENMARNGIGGVSLVVAGLDEAEDRLLASHPSILRILQTVRVDPIAEKDRRKFIEKLLTELRIRRDGIRQMGAEACHAISEEALELLCRLFEGYVFWALLIGKYAFDESNADENGWVHLDVGAVIRGYNRALVDIARSACRPILDEQDPLLHKMVVWLAASGRPDLEISLLAELSGAEGELVQKAIRRIASSEAFREERDPAAPRISFEAAGYQRWFVREFNATDAAVALPSFREAVATLEQHFRVIGEDVPGYHKTVTFIRDELKKWDLEQYGGLLEFQAYNHQKIFSGLPLSPAVERFVWNQKDPTLLTRFGPKASRGEEHQETDEYPKKTYENLAQIWEEADAVAIPVYLLPEAYRLGVYDLGELAAKFEPGNNWQRYLEIAAIAFARTCMFKREWIALPFSLIPRLYYSRQCALAPAPSNGGSEGGESATLIEAEKGSISLAYQWLCWLSCFSENLGATGLFRFDRNRMDVTPAPSEGLIQDLAKFRKLACTDAARQTSWNNGLVNFSRTYINQGYSCYWGWADWYLHEQREQAKLAASIKHPDPRQRKCSTSSVIADAWVLVLPKIRLLRNPSSQASRISLLKLLLSMLGLDWQIRFHEAAGTSALRPVLLDTRSWEMFPWLSDFNPNDVRLVARGVPYEHFTLQATSATLSLLLSSNDPLKPEKIRKKLEGIASNW